MSRRRSRSAPRGRWRDVLLLGGLVAVTAGALYLALAAGDRPPPVDQQADNQRARALKRYEQRLAHEHMLERTVQVARPDSGPLRVLFVGDSLTAGYYADTPSDAYPQVVTHDLRASGPVTPLLAKQAGAAVGTVSAMVQVPAHLDLAVIELGTNDVGDGTDLGAFEKAYTGLIGKIRRRNPDVPLVCLGVWYPDGDSRTITYDTVIQRDCFNAGGRFETMGPLNSDPANIGPAGRPTFRGTSDTFHPNNAGHKAIARLVLGALNLT